MATHGAPKRLDWDTTPSPTPTVVGHAELRDVDFSVNDAVIAELDVGLSSDLEEVIEPFERIFAAGAAPAPLPSFPLSERPIEDDESSRLTVPIVPPPPSARTKVEVPRRRGTKKKKKVATPDTDTAPQRTAPATRQTSSWGRGAAWLAAVAAAFGGGYLVRGAQEPSAQPFAAANAQPARAPLEAPAAVRDPDSIVTPSPAPIELSIESANAAPIASSAPSGPAVVLAMHAAAPREERVSSGPGVSGAASRELDPIAANAALRRASAAASACPSDRATSGSVAVIIGPSGQLVSAVVTGELAGTALAACVEKSFMAVSIPAFDGAPFKSYSSFSVRGPTN